MSNGSHFRFIINDAVLVVTAPKVTLGSPEVLPELVIAGDTQGSGACICYRNFTHWIEPLRRAKACRRNFYPVDRPLPLMHDDDILFGDVVVRVVDPIPPSRSLVLEGTGTSGLVRLGCGSELPRVVLLQNSLLVAARPPCHVGLSSLGSDTLEITRNDRGELICRSLTGGSSLAISFHDHRYIVQPVTVPGELVALPLDWDYGSERAAGRLRFRPA